MSHYETNYDGLEGSDKRAKALADIVEYLGWKKFVEIHEGFLKEGKQELGIVRRWLSFAGVQGYPAQAWYEHLWGEVQ